MNIVLKVNNLEKLQKKKKTTFENDSDDAIPESVSKLNKIISCNSIDSDS